MNSKSILLAVAIVMLMPVSAVATRYKCNTKQAFYWHAGKIIPDKTIFFKEHGEIYFDDLTSSLSLAQAAKDGSSFFVPEHFDAFSTHDSPFELTASTNMMIDKKYITFEIFRIETDTATNELNFFLYKSLEGLIISGKCSITKELP